MSRLDQNSSMAKGEPVERALTKLQGLIRRPPSRGEEMVRTGERPEDLRSEGVTGVGLFADQDAALKELRSLMSEDLRFEYLKDPELKSVTWRFVCLAHLQRKGDLVAEFVAKHARQPIDRTCFFPVELLKITDEVELYGVKLMPPGAVERPPTLFGHDPGPTMGSIVAVECTGTDRGKMGERARAVAERALAPASHVPRGALDARSSTALPAGIGLVVRRQCPRGMDVGTRGGVGPRGRRGAPPSRDVAGDFDIAGGAEERG
jgi:hypothetical protein